VRHPPQEYVVADRIDPSPSDSGELVRRLRARDRRAFAEFAIANTASLFRAISRLVRDPARAADATQEALLSVWTNIESFDGHSKISTWARTIAVRAALQELRRGRRHEAPPSEGAPVGGAPDQIAPVVLFFGDAELSFTDHGEAFAYQQELERRLGHVRKLLPPQQFAIVLLTLQGKSAQVVADLLGLQKAQVEQQRSRAIRALQGLDFG